MIIVAGSLLIVGYLALGALLQLLVGDLATGLGLTGIVVSPAFGYAGVGFPVFGMNAFAQSLGRDPAGALVHGRAARAGGARIAASRIRAPVRGAGGARRALLRARIPAPARGRAERDPAERRRAAPPVAPAAPRGVGGAFAAEWRRVLTIRGAFILLVLAPLVYGFYYPQPYLNQILRKIPIAVVDNDLSELSRRIVETLDASGAVRVAVRTETLAEAHAAVDRGEALAVVGIPPRDRARRAQGQRRPHSDLRRCDVSVHLQNHRRSGIATAIGTLVVRSSPPAAPAPTAASSRRRSRRRAPPTSCCSRSSIPSAATRATSCRRPSC